MNEAKQITATYEDALRFIEREIVRNGFDMAVRAVASLDAGRARATMVKASIELSSAARTVAFCYGTTEDRMIADIRKLAD